MNLAGLWQNSYFTWNHPLAALDARAWRSTPGGTRPSTTSTTPGPRASIATSSPPSPISTASTSTGSPTHQARDLDDRIFENYKDQQLDLPRRHRAGEHRADVQ